MTSYDPAYANSSGYFKDPGTGEDLSVDMERSVTCELRDGKFIWPQVTVSTGESVKIVYKYFTDEEKQLYKEYRGRGSGSSTPRQSRQKKGEAHLDPVTGEVVYDELAPEPAKPKTVAAKTVHVDPADYEVDYVGSEESTASENTKQLIAECDRIIGVCQIAGISYALLMKDKAPGKVFHVPRALLTNSDIERLS